jgi:hypothetical protein
MTMRTMAMLLVLLLALSLLAGCGRRRGRTAETPPQQPAPQQPAAEPPAPAPAPQATSTPVQQEDALSAQEYLRMLFEEPNNPQVALHIPHYSYFQGLVYSDGEINLRGPIRVVGAVVGGAGTVTLQAGAMLTTDSEYLQGKIEPSRVRYRVTEWREVP